MAKTSVQYTWSEATWKGPVCIAPWEFIWGLKYLNLSYFDVFDLIPGVNQSVFKNSLCISGSLVHTAADLLSELSLRASLSPVKWFPHEHSNSFIFHTAKWLTFQHCLTPETLSTMTKNFTPQTNVPQCRRRSSLIMINCRVLNSAPLIFRGAAGANSRS